MILFLQAQRFINSVKTMKKILPLLFSVSLTILCFSSCSKDEKKLIKEWPGDAYDFMEGIPQFVGEQHTAEIDEDFETVSIYYKDATIEQVYSYIEQLKGFGLEEYISTTVKDGKYQWVSKMEEEKLFAEIFWYDRSFELESGSYSYSLVIKFAEY